MNRIESQHERKTCFKYHTHSITKGCTKAIDRYYTSCTFHAVWLRCSTWMQGVVCRNTFVLCSSKHSFIYKIWPQHFAQAHYEFVNSQDQNWIVFEVRKKHTQCLFHVMYGRLHHPNRRIQFECLLSTELTKATRPNPTICYTERTSQGCFHVEC